MRLFVNLMYATGFSVAETFSGFWRKKMPHFPSNWASKSNPQLAKAFEAAPINSNLITTGTAVALLKKLHFPPAHAN